MKQQVESAAKAAEYRNWTAQVLSDLVKIPSPSAGEQAVVEKIQEILHSVGVTNTRVDGLGSLIAKVGDGEQILAFDAHIDTVGTGDPSQWDDDPFSGTISGGFVHGRGSTDQKGGAASMIAAARILTERADTAGYTLYFTFTVMEEDCDGLCWKYLIEKEQIRPNYVCITEPTSLGVYRGQRGRMEFDIDFTGISAHGSAPERGINAVTMAAKTALAIEDLNAGFTHDEFLGRGSAVVTQATSSSPSLCAVPDGASLHVDRRLTWGETADSATKEIEKAIEGLGIADRAEVKIPVYDVAGYRGENYPQEQYFPTWKTDADHPLYQAGLAAAAQIGVEASATARWTFSTNAVSICGRFGIPCIGFGPGNEPMAHAPNEKVPIDHLEAATAFYVELPTALAKASVNA